jgi:Tfp pilus assembly protein PilN
VVKINLLPLKVRKTKVAIQLYTYMVIAGSAVVILLIILLLNLLTQTRRVEIQIKNTNAARAGLAEKVGPLLQLKQQEAEIQKTWTLMQQLRQGQTRWILLLDELADRIQDDLWLTRLSSRQKDEQSPLQLVLEGEAYQKIVVADFMQSLEKSKRFQNVSLETLTESTGSDTATQVQFKMKTDFHDALPETGGRP